MKSFVARCTFTDRRQGPGTGRTIEAQANSLPGAAGKAIREFWKGLDRKQRFDCVTSGLEVRITLRKEAIE